MANEYSHTVSVIDTATNTVVKTVAVAVGSFPFGIAVHPDGSRVYVANEGSGGVSVIDTATNTVVKTVTVVDSTDTPFGVAVHPDGSRVYVANEGSHTVAVIDTATNTVIATVAVEVPVSVAVHPDGSRVYVANVFSHTVSVIDTATNTVVKTVAVGEYPFGVAVHPDGSRVYVANQVPGTVPGTVSVIDTATNTVVETVQVGLAPIAFGQFIGPAATVSPVPSVNPPSLDFLTVTVGTSSDKTFTVQNTGGGTLTGSASTSAPFSIFGNNSFNLAGGQSQTITVRFTPTSARIFEGDVSVTSNGGNTSVFLAGIGFVPASNQNPPRITSISPGSGVLGDTITILDGTWVYHSITSPLRSLAYCRQAVHPAQLLSLTGIILEHNRAVTRSALVAKYHRPCRGAINESAS